MNITFLNELRVRELEGVLRKHRAIFANKRVLEIGGGTGAQAEILAGVASEVASLEIAESNYRGSANHRIALYDGHHLPFSDSSFDVVYSSNVLEHVAHRDEFQNEIARVLKPNGYAIHIMPTQWWKLRDIVENILFLPLKITSVGYKKYKNLELPSYRSPLEFLVGGRHGEFGDTLTELYYFVPRTWIGHFQRLGWNVEDTYGGEFFYTGRLILGTRLPWKFRKLLASCLGSTIRIYVLRNESS